MPDPTIVDRIAADVVQEVGPSIQDVDIPAQEDARDRAQREANLENRLKEVIGQHVAGMSGQDISAVAEEMLQDPSLDPKTAKVLRDALDEMQKTSQPLRDVLFTSLCDADKRGVKDIKDLSDADKQKAGENLKSLLETCSEEKLQELYDKVGLKTDPAPQNKQEMVEALLKSNLLERSLQDSKVTAELTEVLADSGKLPKSVSGLLKELVEKSRAAIEELSALVAQGILDRVHEIIEAGAKSQSERSSESSIAWTPAQLASQERFPYAELLRRMLVDEDEATDKPKLKVVDELGKALIEIGEALHAREEKEQKRKEEEELKTQSALMRAIESIASRNPELFRQLAGMSIEQTKFLALETRDQRVGPYQSVI